ncbi:uncharacterized protein ATNIH1004_008633 [Aspergillus tanneri]|uniref:Major facilitator superfamily (MFS) profile domain-containing protein n=1 Tax=Aspergillus tanneri TaxID=1220188 RepID=A0A5M9MJ26_9EURO|nr:uncharacterized protein ATNIH1004_008633 [Aspergillus tanneri]KAA8644429.1 hypothetical protein ATNIH1004_008633 [Aspergillus tanneri]
MARSNTREDRSTPKEVYNWRLYSEAAIIATGSVLYGYDSAFIGTTISRQSFKAAFNIGPDDAADISSNITSTFQAGAFFGAILCFLLTEKCGRKWALQANVVVFLVGAILTVAATHQLSFIYAGRALTGVACGAITATVPSYIAELSIDSIRGILTGMFEVAYQVGTLVGFWINYGINQSMDLSSTASWKIPMGVQLIPASVLFLGGFALHESPLWLMRKGREEDAAQALECIRKLPPTHAYVQEELEMARNRLVEESKIARNYGHGAWALFRGTLFELSRPGMRNRVLLVFCAFTLQNMSGAAAINYYSPTLFSSIGISDVALYTGIYGLVKGAYVKVGHPADIIASGKQLSPSTAAGGRAATVMIMIYSVLLTQFAITKALPYIFQSFGYGTWFFFASWMMLASTWAFFFLPETKGRTIYEMDVIFGYVGNPSSEDHEIAVFQDGKEGSVSHCEERV